MKYETKQRDREERTNARSSCAKQEAEKRSAASVTTLLRNLSSLASKHFLWMLHILLPTCIERPRLIPLYLCVSLPGIEREHYSGLVVEASNVRNKLLNLFGLLFLFTFRHLFLALRYDPDQCGVGFFLYIW